MTIKNKRDALNVFDSYLTGDETLLWVGQPNPRWLLSSSDALMIPFSLMWGGFAIFWEAGVLSSKAPFPFPLWGIPFVVMGQYFIWGRFIHKYLRRRTTYYAITNRRALVLNTLFGTSLKAHFLHQIDALHRERQSVIFGNDAPFVARQRTQDLSGEARPGFYALEDADDVYRLMQDLILATAEK